MLRFSSPWILLVVVGFLAFVTHKTNAQRIPLHYLPLHRVYVASVQFQRLPSSGGVGGAPGLSQQLDLIVDTGSFVSMVKCCTLETSPGYCSMNQTQSPSWIQPCDSLEEKSIGMNLNVDGETATFGFYEDSRMYQMMFPSLSNQTDQTSSASLSFLRNKNDISKSYWNAQVQGQLGFLFSSDFSQVWGMYAFLRNNSFSAFAFRLHQNRSENYLELNSNISLTNVTFAEPYFSPPPMTRNRYVARLFNLNLCGVRIFANYSSNWIAMIDSGARCLGLPAEFFDSVLAWTGIQCAFPPSLSPVCRLPANVSASDLCPLRFQLSQEDLSIPFFISWSDLIYDTNRVCIFRKPSIRPLSSSASFYYDLASITFGSMTLSSFYTVFNLTRQSIGFRAEYSPSPPIPLTAGPFSRSYTDRFRVPTRPKCVGEQVYYFPLNSCEEPQCNVYFFRRLNTETHLCEISSWFYTFIGILLTLFFFLEIFVLRCHLLQGRILEQHMRRLLHQD